MFTGSIVAIVTPFKNGRVDERTFGDLIEWQIANGTNGIVPCGTTGESATLTHEEHHRVIKLTVEAVKRHLDGIVKGDLVRYELPHLWALQFVGRDALGGGVTTSLALDAHGKSLSAALLEMEIETAG